MSTLKVATLPAVRFALDGRVPSLERVPAPVFTATVTVLPERSVGMTPNHTSVPVEVFAVTVLLPSEAEMPIVATLSAALPASSVSAVTEALKTAAPSSSMLAKVTFM